MTRSSIEEKVRKILSYRLDVSESKITPRTDLIEDCRMYQSDFDDIVDDIYEEFHIAIPNEWYLQMYRMEDIVDHIYWND